MEPVEYKAVMRLLYLKGSALKEALDEMIADYGEDAPSYDVVKHWHRQFKCSHTPVEIVSDSWAPTVCHWWYHHSADWDRHFWGSSCNRAPCGQNQCWWCGKIYPWRHGHGKGVCSMDSTVAHAFTEEERVKCAKALLTMYQDNQEDEFHRTKHGFITMIRRQNLSLSDGNIMARHLRKRHVSNHQRAKPYWHYFGISA